MGELLLDVIWGLIEWIVELALNEELKPRRIVM
jgi:hypothetical protein